MKGTLIGSLAVGLLAAPALAGSSANWRSLDVTLTNYFDTGGYAAWSFTGGGGGGGPAGALANLYQNIPVFAGGLGTAGGMTPMGANLTYAFVWFGSPIYQVGDDLHGISGMGGGLQALVTAIQYGYATGVPAVTTPHVIKLYDMINPSQPHGTGGPVVKGALLRQITYLAPPATMGAFVTLGAATIGGPILLPAGAIWIKYGQNPGSNTYWLMGGVPYGGSSSFNGVLAGAKPPNPVFNGWYYYPAGFIPLNGGALPIKPNISMGLRGFHVPAPAAIALLGLGGLGVLRRRRVAA